MYRKKHIVILVAISVIFTTAFLINIFHPVKQDIKSSLDTEFSEKISDIKTRTEAATAMGQCLKCHRCDKPTHQDKCLLSCTRDARHEQAIKEHAKISHLNDIIVLKELINIYEPVEFEHKKHATMALMGTGCSECHHFSPAGENPPSCKNCHDSKVDAEHIQKPGLKGAYHRQCMKCHTSWAGNENCAICHPLKGMKVPGKIGGSVLDLPRKKPKDLITFKTNFDGEMEVVFNHKQHMTDFGLECAGCHTKANSCNDCHNQKEILMAERQKPIHQLCTKCHNQDSCDRCHSGINSKTFDHAKTGWPLSKYHQKIGCRQCHKEKGHYLRQKKECSICHKNWTVKNFDHAKITTHRLTGQHATFNCEECHARREFTKKPTCQPCHEKQP